jgi:mannose-6-phosphate isomerase-like protein (cupin superfamily)
MQADRTAAAERQDAPKAQTFRLRTQLLQKGRSHTILASSRGPDGAMNIAIKCYAGGGENEFHTHAVEDHTFIVLQGRAVFYQPDSSPQELGRNEGILLPAGAYYKFEAVSEEPLVLLRVGNVWQPVQGKTEAAASHRLGADGAELPSRSLANKHVDAIPLDGAFYE